MRVTVRLFATMRRRAGTEVLDLELADGATTADALAALAARTGLADLVERMPLRMAVNREYVSDDVVLSPGDELAVIPPVSGGAGPITADRIIRARVSEEPLSLEALVSSVSRPGAGAIVVFAGTPRHVGALEYEAYREMAEPTIASILAGCAERHRLEAAAAEHRFGTVPQGEPSVIVAVSAAHRQEAFDAAREAIDEIKAEAPIWKVERSGRAIVRDGVSGNGVGLTHLDRSGSARMVDVSSKPITDRCAQAEAVVRMSPDTARAVVHGDSKKGDVLGTARIAGVQAAKRTDQLIPLAHTLPLTEIDLDLTLDPDAGRLSILATARARERTGVEMEAMTAASVAALTVYDMTKGLERGVEIAHVRLLSKSGGRHDWLREAAGR